MRGKAPGRRRDFPDGSRLPAGAAGFEYRRPYSAREGPRTRAHGEIAETERQGISRPGTRRAPRGGVWLRTWPTAAVIRRKPAGRNKPQTTLGRAGPFESAWSAATSTLTCLWPTMAAICSPKRIGIIRVRPPMSVGRRACCSAALGPARELLYVEYHSQAFACLKCDDRIGHSCDHASDGTDPAVPADLITRPELSAKGGLRGNR
jgi:hypothetical protein